MPALSDEAAMAKREYEFTLILSGVRELSREVLDGLYEAGCDDALVGMRNGVAYADFCREANSFPEAVLSAIRDVEAAGVGTTVEHVEPDELVTMAEIARRLRVTREAVRKWAGRLRGPGGFPPPAGCLTRRSPVWRWTDVLRWHQLHQQTGQARHLREPGPVTSDTNRLLDSGTHIAALNAALDLRRRVSFDQAVQLLRRLPYTTSDG